jgi:hypothetical protein
MNSLPHDHTPSAEELADGRATVRSLATWGHTTEFSAEDWGPAQTVLQFHPFCGIVVCAGFWHGKHTEAELVTQWVQFGEQVQQA